jgi:hypothetical protein
MRPVVYAYKDGSTFAFSNYAALLKWHQVYKKLGGRINRAGCSPTELERTIIPIARELDADYIFVYFGDYFEKIRANADSKENFAAKAKVITPTDFSGAVEEHSNPGRIDLNGVSNVWSNRQYGLYKLVK